MVDSCWFPFETTKKEYPQQKVQTLLVDHLGRTNLKIWSTDEIH